jgi:L-ascorbate metabolism protein UlaG (beta-lactamase superfamily)
MKLTHFGHACLLVETGEARILIDPGAFSAGFETVAVDAVLITHRHADHFDVDRVAALLRTNPDATLWLESSTPLEHVDIAADRVHPVSTGDVFSVKGSEVHAVGGTHALIHADIDLIPNVGFYFPAEEFLHPGDEFIKPGGVVRILATPISGPWQAMGDFIDYVRAVSPEIVVPIHEAILARPPIYLNYLEQLKPAGTVVAPWEAQGVAVEF